MVTDDPKALVRDTPPPVKRTPTPDIYPLPDLTVFKTPRNSQDVHTALTRVTGNVSPSNRTVRALLRKVEKALNEGNVKRAGLEVENDRLVEDLRAVEPHTRKRVHEAGNDKFTRIVDIIEAEEAAHKTPKRRRVVRRTDPGPVVEEVHDMIVHGLDRLHGIEEV